VKERAAERKKGGQGKWGVKGVEEKRKLPEKEIFVEGSEGEFRKVYTKSKRKREKRPQRAPNEKAMRRRGGGRQNKKKKKIVKRKETKKTYLQRLALPEKKKR